MEKKGKKVYSGLDDTLRSIPRVNPVVETDEEVERRFEIVRDSFWGDGWMETFRKENLSGIQRYASRIYGLRPGVSKFKKRKNVQDYWHIRADMYVTGMMVNTDAFFINDQAIVYYGYGKKSGDPYCSRVLDAWDEMVLLARNPVKENFIRMEQLAYDEQLIPAMILLGCMYLQIGLTKKAEEVKDYMFFTGRNFCYFLNEQIKLCKKLRKNRCIHAYGTIAYVLVLILLVLFWKAFAIIRFLPFVGLVVASTMLYCLIDMGRSQKVSAASRALCTFLDVISGAGSYNNGAKTTSVYACYGWLPTSWEFYLSKTFFGM